MTTKSYVGECGRVVMASGVPGLAKGGGRVYYHGQTDIKGKRDLEFEREMMFSSVLAIWDDCRIPLKFDQSRHLKVEKARIFLNWWCHCYCC